MFLINKVISYSNSQSYQRYCMCLIEFFFVQFRTKGKKMINNRLVQQGFSLVEIVIVIAMIALMAAILIPNLLRSKLNANENAAQNVLKQVSQACERYRITQPIVSYPQTVTDLTSAEHIYCDPAIFDPDGFQGYVFTYTPGSAKLKGVIQTFDCGARPVSPNVSGVHWFVINETGVLREDLNADGIADASDTALQD
jgi:type IV pilus assembly protein PilA